MVHRNSVQICIVPLDLQKINCFFKFFPLFWIESLAPQKIGQKRQLFHYILRREERDMRNRRTDLALEARELWQESAEERTCLLYTSDAADEL